MKLTKAMNALFEAKRDLLYSGETLFLMPFLCYFAFRNGNPLKEILEKDELPYDLIFLVGLSEAMKLLVVFLVYPFPHLPDLGRSYDGGSKSHRLPYSKRDSSSKNINQTSFLKPMELMKGAINFVGAFVLCHIMLVLFGAPFIKDYNLTFQFSMILVFWLLFPLCMVIRPSVLLSELVYISAWSGDNKALCRGKWRFLVLILGTWMGAVVMPLDWDRPWQKWPIPCLMSATFSYTAVNLLYFLYLFVSLYNPQLIKSFSSKSSHSSKIKCY